MMMCSARLRGKRVQRQPMTNGGINVEIGNPSYNMYEVDHDNHADAGSLLRPNFTLDPHKVGVCVCHVCSTTRHSCFNRMEFSVWLRAETRLLPSQTCGVKVTEELWVGLKHAAESVRMFSHTNVSVITFSYKLIKVIHFQFSSHIWFNVTLVGQRLQVSAALNTESLIIFAHIKLTARVFQLNKVFTTLTNLYHLISYKLNWQYSRCWLLFIRILRGEILMVITILFLYTVT